MLGMRLNLDALGQFPQLLYIPVLRCFMAIRRTEVIFLTLDILSVVNVIEWISAPPELLVVSDFFCSVI